MADWRPRNGSQNWFLYFFGAVFNSIGLLLVVAIGRQPLNSMFSGLSQVRACTLFWHGIHCSSLLYCLIVPARIRLSTSSLNTLLVNVASRTPRCNIGLEVCSAGEFSA